MPLVICHINRILNWSENCVLFATAVAIQVATYRITGTTFYVPLGKLCFSSYYYGKSSGNT